ncbi:MAG: F420-nonreducing hydrogenase [Bacillota bacterium]
MPDKLKLAYFLSGGCGGCDMAIIDLSETLIDLLLHLEVVFWVPTITDTKYKDLEAIPDRFIDLGLYSGMVRLQEHEYIAKMMRRKCKVLVAYGACAALGGIPGLGNMHTREEILKTAYFDTSSTDNPEGLTPQTRCVVSGKYELTLPEFYGHVRTLQDVVDVDYFIGGCPPHHSFVRQAIPVLLFEKLPAPGSWITSGKAVCDVCDRNPVKKGEERQLIREIKRTLEGAPDEGKCLLQEGYLCLGPVTQGDCGSLCPKVNIPCMGCGGPIPGVRDFGLRAISAIAGLLSSEELVDQIPSPVKYFYRYSLPASMLRKKLGKV